MNKNTASGMDASPLGVLPAEIRNNIYFEIFQSHDPVIVSCDIVSQSITPRRCNYLPGILETCTQARAEATAMFFALNKFELHIRPRQAREVFQFHQDEARHLWVFLKSLKFAQLPTPKDMMVRIVRTFSHIGVGQVDRVSGCEIMHQLGEVRKFAKGHQISNMTCVVETSWGNSSVATKFTMAGMHEKASARLEEIEMQHPMGCFPKTAEGMATLWHWKVLTFVRDATRAQRVQGAVEGSGPKPGEHVQAEAVQQGAA